MPKAKLTLYDLDTGDNNIPEHSLTMEIESLEEAEENDNYYEVAMEWASDDLGYTVYSYSWYEWELIEEDE